MEIDTMELMRLTMNSMMYPHTPCSWSMMMMMTAAAAAASVDELTIAVDTVIFDQIVDW